MILRTRNKDHRQESGGIPVSTTIYSDTGIDDVLRFWVQNPLKSIKVDLTVFSSGWDGPAPSPNWKGNFSGRPGLIEQLAPAIKEILTGFKGDTIKEKIVILRSWWRVLDAVDAAVAGTSGVAKKVDDVQDICGLHYECAMRQKLSGESVSWFMSMVNSVLKLKGLPILGWESFSTRTTKRHLPPESEVAVLRMGLKQEWEIVKRRWALCDRVSQENFVPTCDTEIDLHRHLKFLRNQQRKWGVTVPTSDQLRGGVPPKNFSASGLNLTTLRSVSFPTVWDMGTAFHLCLSNTGWNPAVLYSLDVTKGELMLRSNPQDQRRYILIGIKVRAGYKEQVVTGLWKTSWGPGAIIRDCIERVRPLREQLLNVLALQCERFAQMQKEDASVDELHLQLNVIRNLEAGCRSIWLYVSRSGAIEWLDDRSQIYYYNSTCGLYPAALIFKINSERHLMGQNPIGTVTASDFRDIFALYVWRQSGSNVLAVMRMLNHAHLRTTQRYLDNNILNAERDGELHTFLEHLFSELGEGRLDITILAYLQQYGELTPEMEKRLIDFRALEKSRLGIGCKEPKNPPPQMSLGSVVGKLCGAQRCLLCAKNSILLPESLLGIAMRVEELIAIQSALSSETWLRSDFSIELENGLAALAIFPQAEVASARYKWSSEIKAGFHHVPGLPIQTTTLE